MSPFKSIRILLVLGLLSFASSALAELTLPGIFGNHMVLQQGQAVPVWGWAEPSEEVRVEFKEQSLTTTADENGRWKVELSPLAASADPAILKITGSKEILFQDVVVGDVWLCSGQSNMEWNVNQSGNKLEEKAAANFPLIRHIKIPRAPSNTHKDNFKSNWQVASPETVGNFTAVGYYFARTLHQEMNTPIGLINSSWGGTRIEPWVNKQGLQIAKDAPHVRNMLLKIEDLDNPPDAKKDQINQQLDQLQGYISTARNDIAEGKHPTTLPNLVDLMAPGPQAPTRLYRGMIHPLVPYALKGAIWYQGESNSGQALQYADYKKALVEGWRDVWGQGSFPFYWVQLANYTPDSNQPGANPGWGLIREAQTKAMEIPNSGMAVIIDIGDTKDIHPKNKQDVGKRLAQWALTQTYGQTGVPCGPMYKSNEVVGNEIHIHFDHVGQGLIVGEKPGYDPVREIENGELKRFAIAGADRNWVWANARIVGDTVVLSSSEVAEPLVARYAFSSNPLGANLYNRDGFPAGPFRTDNW